LVVAEEDYVLLRRSTDKITARGAHGYDPQVTDMQAIFLAAGPNVRPLGRIPAFENVNVYPFLAALLRLDRPPVVDGNASVLGSILK
jgi:alkaline phosphatase D